MAKRAGLKAIAFDEGTGDRAIAQTCRDLGRVLDDYGIPHVFEEYDGDHTNRIAERIRTHVLPFFSEQLEFE